MAVQVLKAQMVEKVIPMGFPMIMVAVAVAFL
jgi:hypothetical protein